MNQELALVPQYVIHRGNRVHENVLAIVLGVLFLGWLAQVAIPLPWTPVPITGQTFGVTLTALVWGRKRATMTVFSYLALGGIGVPIFAMGRSGIPIGPTTGYLVGMAAAAYLMGALADRGWTRTWLRSYLAALLGSLAVLSCGVVGLSLFFSFKDLWHIGVFPFLPGDLLKTLLASCIAFGVQHSLDKQL